MCAKVQAHIGLMTLTFISSGQGSRYAAIYLLFILPFLRKEAFLPRWLVKVEAILWCVASCGWSAHMHTPGSDTYIFIFLSISHTHIAVSGAVMWRWSVNDLTSVRETSLTVFKTSCFSSTSISLFRFHFCFCLLLSISNAPKTTSVFSQEATLHHLSYI